MDLNKLTMKSQAALQEAGRQATARHHQLIEPEHVLVALLADAEGVVFPLLHHVGATPAQLRARVDEALDAMPKVYAQGVEVRISPATAKLLEAAGAEAESLTDEYISTEHLLLAMLVTPGTKAAGILSTRGSRATPRSPRSPMCAGAGASRARPPRTRSSPSRSMDVTSPRPRARASSTR